MRVRELLSAILHFVVTHSSDTHIWRRLWYTLSSYLVLHTVYVLEKEMFVIELQSNTFFTFVTLKSALECYMSKKK